MTIARTTTYSSASFIQNCYKTQATSLPMQIFTFLVNTLRLKPKPSRLGPFDEIRLIGWSFCEHDGAGKSITSCHSISSSNL
uniref:Uncharacterized protein n=1 Tax=Arundo donax TaxID=35708 RepID=A0A0A9AVT5_ARUDO